MKHLYISLTFLCCLAAFRSSAQLPAAYSARLQTVLDSMCERYHIKGASAAVHVPGRGTWTGVHGESHSGQPITPAMAFPLNSNTKTYIAALLLKMQQDGDLALSDTIGTWIQNQPNVNGQITIRQLLAQTSGLYNYTDNSDAIDSIEADFSRIWQPHEMLPFINAPLYAPGTNWNYSNTNFLLAGMIIAQVSGMPVEQAIRTKLLQPQGLGNTWFYPQEAPTAPIPHFWFYTGSGIIDGDVFGYTPESFYSAASAAGALFGTAEDNVLFWHKLISGGIINAASLNEWRHTTPLNNSVGYGLGMFRYKNFNGRVVYEHGGTGAGAINENLADSASGVCISVLTNQDSASNSILLNQVVHALHRITLNPPTAIYQPAAALACTLYPNPAQGALHIRWAGAPRDGVRYVITDAAGRTVRTGDLASNPDDAISLSGLGNGLYFLQLSAAGHSATLQPFTVLR